MKTKLFSLLTIFILFLVANKNLCSQNYSFVVTADNRSNTTQYNYSLQEINDFTFNSVPTLPYPEFFVTCGDFDPVQENYNIYNDTISYPNLPPFYLTVGNHEFENSSYMDFIKNIIIPNSLNIVNNGPQCSYSFDYENIHCIVVDQYANNDEGELDLTLQEWVQNDINQTNKDRIFIFGHEPAFPINRHTGDSMNQFPDSRNDFWNILVNDPRIYAYFCGHTHYYYRMRVLDPTTVGTTDLPDQNNGVYQIDVGAIGNATGEGDLTIVYCSVYEDSILFRSIGSDRNTISWHLRDEWTLKNVKRYNIDLLNPQGKTTVSDTTEIKWSFDGKLDPNSQTIIYVSRNKGINFDTLCVINSSDTSYPWNTSDYPDGTRYTLKIVTKIDSGFGVDYLNDCFTINNPGNGIPEIELLNPSKNESISNNYSVNWIAQDADGDSLLLDLKLSFDNGLNWENITSNENNDSTFIWNTISQPNSNNCLLKLICSDTIETVNEISPIFSINNSRIAISDTNLYHISGNGDGNIQVNIVDSTSLTNHQYKITFDDTFSTIKTYDIFDMDLDKYVITNSKRLSPNTEGPLFDGLRLLINDYSETEVNNAETGWTIGNSDLNYSISLPEISIDSEIIYGFAYPSDYKITCYNDIVDTSGTFYSTPAIPIKFRVKNITEDHFVDIIYVDNYGNSFINKGSQIYIFETGESDSSFLTWQIIFSGDDNSIDPSAEDEFTFKTLTPFTSNDIFEFPFTTSAIRENSSYIPNEFIVKQNYPNPFNPSTTIEFSIPKLADVELNIYNVLGQRIRTTRMNNKQAGNYRVIWNGTNDLGAKVSTGIYFYKIDAGKYSNIKKMVFLK